MTPQENFRLGFLMRCAEEGCTPEEVQERVKLASACLNGTMVKEAVGNVLGPLWSAAKTIGYMPVHASALGIAGGAGLGAIGGYGLAKLQSSDVDPEEAKQQELIAALKLQAEMARRRAAQRQYRRPIPASPHF